PALPPAAVAGMRPVRDSARASAASTSSIACTQARSDTVASITSVLRLGPKSASDGKEDRLPFALQPDVEVQHATAILRDEGLPSRRFDEVQNRIRTIGLGLVRKIHPRHQVTEQAPCENRDVEVRRLHASIRRGNRSWLDRREAEGAFRIRASASESRGGLPDFEQRVRNRLALAVEDLALNSHHTDGSRRRELLALLEWQSDAKKGTDGLRRRQRPAHCSASKGVAA